MRFDKILGLTMAAICSGAIGQAQAESLVVDNGEITAVVGVEIQGGLYDLRFVDSSFNGGYPADFAGYGVLACDAVKAIVAASDSGTLQARRDLRPRGCASSDACTILIPNHATGSAPSAAMSYACELIHVGGQFRSGDPQWPFDPSTDTGYMPDMTYAILTPAR
ncbi:hypothetical protein [Thiorhodococcus fuscus]|uniref:Uncharacterized protein n=1 Tax=Thiorhodococcus fuscus TaxID=527200 RepID=A0ABW4Y523_9GAMM